MQLIDGQTLAALIAELRRVANRSTVDEKAGPDPVCAPADAQRSGPAPSTQFAAVLLTEPPIRILAFFRTLAHLGLQAAEAVELWAGRPAPRHQACSRLTFSSCHSLCV